MKKYTKRLKAHIHEWRAIKNWIAVAILIANFIHMMATHGSWEIVISAFFTAMFIIGAGETAHHLLMSWVETAESIQKRDETI